MPPHAGVPAVAYLICATPRSGSTLLCGLLRSTGVAGRPESYFRLPDEQSWADRWRLARDQSGAFDYRDYVRAAISAGSTANGVFGARVMWGTMDEIVARLGAGHPDVAGSDADVLASGFGEVRFIHLWRADTVAQAVSWARAEQTGHWQDGDTAASHEPRYDFEQIDALVRTVDEHNDAWRRWFAAAGVEPYRVCYEELTEDIDGVTRRILDFLGLELPGDRAIVAGHRRLSDEINDDWIERFRAAQASPAG